MPGEPRESFNEAGGPLQSAIIAVLAGIAAGSLRLLGASWRVDRGELRRLDKIAEGGGSVIVAFWHESYLPLFVLTEGRDALVAVSASFRGAVIAGICRRFGHQPVFSPKDGRHDAFGFIIETCLRQPGMVAIAVDGPVGPRHQARWGGLRLANALGASIVPVAFEGAPLLRFSRRWDKMALPLPFARVALRVGESIAPPTSLMDPDLARAAADLAAALNGLCAEGEGPGAPGRA